MMTHQGEAQCRPRGSLGHQACVKEDAGLDLNFKKTRILVKGISVADAHAAAQHMLAADPLERLKRETLKTSDYQLNIPAVPPGAGLPDASIARADGGAFHGSTDHASGG
jgi:hypothetical protein